MRLSCVVPMALLSAGLLLACAKTSPLGADWDPGLGTYFYSEPAYYVAQAIRMSDFTPNAGSRADPAYPELNLNVDMYMWPSDNTFGKVTNVREGDLPDSSPANTNWALGLWYKIDGWADQYYWVTANINLAIGTTNLVNYGNYATFRIRAVPLPGAVAGTININLKSPNAVSLLALAQNAAAAQDDPAAKQAAEQLKSGAIPITWEWKTIYYPLRTEDVRSRRCSGFEVALPLDNKGQGGLVLLDDIYIIKYYEKN